MKKNIYKILFVLIICLNLLMLLLTVFMKKEEYSYIENRYYEQFSLSNINAYLTDHFPFRNTFILLKNKVERLSGKTLINNVYVAKDDYLVANFDNNPKRDVIVRAINNFASTHDVYTMIVPDSSFVNEDRLYYHLPILESDEIDYFYGKLNTHNIDLRDIMKNENIDKQLYYRTDHHWTLFGAYEAYKEFCLQKGLIAYNINDLSLEKVSDSFLGTSASAVYGFGKEDSIYLVNKDKEYDVKYVYENKYTSSLYNFDYLDKKDKYSIYLDNNHALIEINNREVSDGSSILILKNSYANSFVPLIVNNYDKVYVIDLRYYSGSVSDYVLQNNIADILVLYNLNNLYSDLSIVKLK